MSSGDFKLRLIMQASNDSPAPLLGNIEGRNWTVTEILEEGNVPSFTCISYAWGPDTDTELNPFYPAIGPPKISIHTLPSLRSAIHSCQSQTPAFWIDAFCIPVFDPSRPETRSAKDATLESMGYIFSTATQVAAVLTRDSYTAINYMVEFANIRRTKETEFVPDAHFDITCLENDLWIRSVWTYQEVMASKYLFLLSEQVGLPTIGLDDSLNAIGYFSSKHVVTNKLYPRLDGFLTIGGEWMVGGDRYALRIMSNLDGRVTGRPRNYWYARISALSTERITRAGSDGEFELADFFMNRCEQLCDFSFIFSAAERESEQDAEKLKRARRYWRPRPGPLPVVFRESNFGSPQRGMVLEDGSLKLYNVATYPVGTQILSKEGIEWLKYLPIREHQDADLDVTLLKAGDEKTILKASVIILKSIGFTGSTEQVVIEDGLFFPQWSIGPCASARILISTVIRYSAWVPGLVEKVELDGQLSYIPGILVGHIRNELWQKGESVILGKSSSPPIKV